MTWADAWLIVGLGLVPVWALLEFHAWRCRVWYARGYMRRLCDRDQWTMRDNTK
jgi:hypothetical protein